MKTIVFNFLMGLFGISMGVAQTDTLLIENVNVIPMIEETILYNQRVVVAHGKIIRVEPMSATLEFQNPRVVDGSGKYLIPGLNEMHYHWRNKEGGIVRDFKLLIANGVTTVRNMAEYDWQDHISIRDSIDDGKLFGPNYFTSGPYLKSGDLQSSADVQSVVEQHYRKGYDFIKIADDLPKAIYLEILEKAQTYHIPVMGHAQRAMDLEYSLRMKSIEHVEEFVYLFDDEQRTDEKFLKNAVEQIKNSGSTVIPTLVVFDMIVKSLDDEHFADLKQLEENKYMLSGDYNYWSSDENPYVKDLKGRVINGMDALVLLDQYQHWMQKFTKMLADAEVPLMTGSDTFGFVVPGFSIHREFQLLEETGLTPFEILKASTIVPAHYLGTIATEGTISEGKNANMVLLNKNPLEYIAHTKSIEGVILKGEWLDREKLDSLLMEVENLNHRN